MAVNLLRKPKVQFFDSNGAPLSGGKLYSYEAGTLTPLDTYADQGEVVTNANPVVLDSAGRADIWLGSDPYKLVLDDSNNNTIWTVDDIEVLPDSIVIENKLRNGAVTTAKIEDDGITADLIRNYAVGTGKLADNAVSLAKRSTFNYDLSSSSGVDTLSTVKLTLDAVTNCEVDITTTANRPVCIALIDDGSGNASSIRFVTGSDIISTSIINIVRDSTSANPVVVNSSLMGIGGGPALLIVNYPVSGIWAIDFPGIGTFNYKLLASHFGGAASSRQFRYCKLVAFEM